MWIRIHSRFWCICLLYFLFLYTYKDNLLLLMYSSLLLYTSLNNFSSVFTCALTFIGIHALHYRVASYTSPLFHNPSRPDINTTKPTKCAFGLQGFKTHVISLPVFELSTLCLPGKPSNPLSWPSRLSSQIRVLMGLSYWTIVRNTSITVEALTFNFRSTDFQQQSQKIWTDNPQAPCKSLITSKCKYFLLTHLSFSVGYYKYLQGFKL